MDKVRMRRDEFEALTACKDCRYFLRFVVRSIGAEDDMDNDEVQLKEQEISYRRCLVGNGTPAGIDRVIVVDCNQFERRPT